MSDIASIHDTFIRSIMADKNIAADYFRNYLPAMVSERLDLTTLTQLPDVYVSEELKKTISDVVYSCQMKDRKGEVKVSLLIEHKSYADKHVAVQIGSYIFSGLLKQLQNEDKVSVIIPILLYHGEDKWQYHTLADLFTDLEPEWKKFVPDFDYIYNNLRGVPDAQINELSNSFLKASLLALKHSFERQWLGENALRLLILSEDVPDSLLRGLAFYLFQQGRLTGDKIIEIMEALPSTQKETVGSIADYFVEKGIEKGLEKGLETAREQTARNMIRRNYTDAEICAVLEVTAEYLIRIRSQMR